MEQKFSMPLSKAIKEGMVKVTNNQVIPCVFQDKFGNKVCAGGSFTGDKTDLIIELFADTQDKSKEVRESATQVASLIGVTF